MNDDHSQSCGCTGQCREKSCTAQSEPLRLADESSERALNLASEAIYRFLAAALTDPRSPEAALVKQPASQALFGAACELMASELGGSTNSLGLGELPASSLSAEALLEALNQPADQTSAEHLRVFGLACRDCPPYETEYQPNEDTFFRAQQMADVAGFYRAFGLAPARQDHERPDCLRLELEFAALLLAKEQLAATAEEAAVCRAARTSFVRDHLCWWVPSFSMALRRKAGSGLYAAVADLLAAWMAIERTRLGLPPSHSPLNPRSEPREECSGCLSGFSGA